MAKLSSVNKPKAAKKAPKNAPSVCSENRGWVLVHFHQRCPYGEVVGKCIPTNMDRAVKMAVDEVIKPYLGELPDKELVSIIRGRIKAKDYAEALAIWKDYMHKKTLVGANRDVYPEDLTFRELPIM